MFFMPGLVGPKEPHRPGNWRRLPTKTYQCRQHLFADDTIQIQLVLSGRQFIGISTAKGKIGETRPSTKTKHDVFRWKISPSRLLCGMFTIYHPNPSPILFSITRLSLGCSFTWGTVKKSARHSANKTSSYRLLYPRCLARGGITDTQLLFRPKRKATPKASGAGLKKTLRVLRSSMASKRPGSRSPT